MKAQTTFHFLFLKLVGCKNRSVNQVLVSEETVSQVVLKDLASVESLDAPFKGKMLLLAIVLASIFGCQKQGKSDDKFISIAAVGGMDSATQDEISSLLKTRNIECYFEGSILYGLHVKKKDAALSIRILRKSKEFSERIIWNPEAEKPLQSQ